MDYLKIKKQLMNKRSAVVKELDLLTEELAEREEESSEQTDDAEVMQKKLETLDMIKSFTDTLNSIDDAIKRIEKGKYGICAHCRKPIGNKRLQVFPFAIYCANCMDKFDE